ncbi:ribonucleoside-diphosphate reductase [Candidatus Nitrososphaera gargensis Ga9.2]|uniref:Vitamin B12-dependent ribonucleotide reductase n=1 Tax=Nitrososphaera gargensis (strain Ga9.2) TaxID=1237085 RepID=K0IBN0_NITGG|nr:adenosylcobalamin-dependent ribonucleoside-diphosphate reductase [Candidatus Nitrososphaera gargensis]AFU56975.1 ribonucleoside-diphosphate reductase [Candidatus Nitrososphaera gargensis Ga9.2]
MAGVTEFNSNSNSGTLIAKIRKRDGRIVNFEQSKISNAIYKALVATGKPDYPLAERLAAKVVQKMVQGEKSVIPSVEDVQDMVESILIEEGLSETAKAYILYRHERRKLRDEKMKILNKRDLDEVDKAFDINSLRVLAARYLLRDSNNEIIEGPKQMFERVATLVAIADVLHDPAVFNLAGGHTQSIEEAERYYAKLDDFDNKLHIGDYYLNKYHFEAMIRHYIHCAQQGQMKVSFKELLRMIAENKMAQYEEQIKTYYNLMVSRDFLPNTPTLMNAGARLGQLSACFVLDMPDDMAGIMKSSTDAAMIFKSGGGVGINYSDLRPEGDIVASTSGVASGPTSFMRIIDTITDVVKQGGKRRGANMGILEAWHPDIEKFVTAKTKPGVFENFNVSVGIWEDFWQALVNKEGNHKYTLRSPRSREPVRQIDAQQLIDLIALSAWRSAEPGVIFFDNINKYNPLINARHGPLRATNPCGEQSLYPYESCNLGSINLANFVKRKADGAYEFDWQRYEQAIRLATRFLDNIIDMNKYPVEEIKVATKETRRIGLGIMGIADLLFLLKIPYNSKDGYEFMNKLAEAVSYLSMDESVAIARARGPFPMFKDSDYVKGRIPVAGYYELPKETHTYDWDTLVEKIKKYGIRNSWTSTIAPTGTLSMIADTANGVEPVFALVYEKRVTVGRFFYTDKVFESMLKENGLYNDEILTKIANNYGSVRGLPEIPEWMQRIFVTAIDIHWTDHVMAQAVWQKWISNAIAKTINMPGDVTAEDVKCAYLLSHELGLKGVTVFRDGSRHEQVLHITGKNTGEKAFAVKPSRYIADYVSTNIKEPYVLEQMQKIFKESGVEEEKPVPKEIPLQEIPAAPKKPAPQPAVPQMAMMDADEDRCPTCNARLIITEGCNVCIECGFSGCGSG